VKKYIKCNIWRVAVCLSYIEDAWLTHKLHRGLFYLHPQGNGCSSSQKISCLLQNLKGHLHVRRIPSIILIKALTNPIQTSSFVNSDFCILFQSVCDITTRTPTTPWAGRSGVQMSAAARDLSLCQISRLAPALTQPPIQKRSCPGSKVTNA